MQAVATDYVAFRNYAGVSDDQVAVDEISHYISKGYLKPFDSLDDLRQLVGGEPILNKIGIITKECVGVVKKA